MFFFQLFFENIFDRKKLKIFDGIFFKVHLLIQENRFESIPKQYQQFKGEKAGVEKNGRAIFALAACVSLNPLIWI